MIYNVAIIGMGNIGVRHLQAILKSSFDMNIYSIDPYADVEGIDSQFEKAGKKKIHFFRDIKLLPEEIDIAVISTRSNVRKEMYDLLISKCDVKQIIFEKVLFQRVTDYEEVQKDLKKRGIKAWVNCIRRAHEPWHELKEKVEDSDRFELHVSGGNWGLGCNGIHMLDLVEFLDVSGSLKIMHMDLSNEIADSKRDGFKEVFGTIAGCGEKCRIFSISCSQTDMPCEISIVTDKERVRIYEGRGQALFSYQTDNWKEHVMEFPESYVSVIGKDIVEDILSSGKCRLPNYDESMQIHLKFIDPLIRFFEERGFEEGICPIT